MSAQPASGYVGYDSASGKFSMLPEQILALADEDSPVFLGAVGSLISLGEKGLRGPHRRPHGRR